MRLLAALLAAATCVAAEVAVPIGDFDVYPEGWILGLGPEFPGADGAIGIDKQAKAGAGCLRFDVDFEHGGGYVQVARRLDDLPMTGFGGWLRSDGVSEIRFRLVDATGQVFQSGYLPVKQGWQRVSWTVAELTKAEHWDGAKDGAWHGPAHYIALMVPKAKLVANRTAGTLWLDAWAATLEAGAKKPDAPPKLKVVELDNLDHGEDGWNFTNGPEFAGATGRILYVTKGTKSGKGCLQMDADFTGGGSYVATTRNLASEEYDVREVSFWVKRTGVNAIGVRLIDGSGQCHQKNGGVSLKPGDGWQPISLQLDEVVGGEHWGGANDGAWHAPLKAISIMVGANKTDSKGSLWIDELRGVTVVRH